MSSPRVVAARRRSVNAVIDALFTTLATAGRLHPMSRPERAGIERLRDIPYGPRPERKLDIYRAVAGPDRGPVVLYIHGGGFRILSKEGYRALAIMYARAGFVAAVIDYRLAPRHAYPAAHEDAAEAYRWVRNRIADYGGDPDRIVVAGDSAGANLALSLAIATAVDRPEPFAAMLRSEAPPIAVIAACGLLQVSDPGRFHRLPRRPALVARDRIEEIARVYLAGARDAAMADPLVLIEAMNRVALAPTFIPVGSADPVLDDSRRLAAALAELDVPHELAVYEGQGHAFNTLVWRADAQRCFEDGRRFMAAHTRGPW